MTLRILALGDVVRAPGVKYLVRERRLSKMRRQLGADLVIVNAENCSEGNGMLPQDAEALFDAGADVLTGGNHTFRRRECYTMLDDRRDVLRPANYPPAAPGHGWTVEDVCGARVLVMNLMGCVFMDSLASPFETADRILAANKGEYDLALVDFHAEASSEKVALARYLDGRVAALWGTHTHIPTADETVLPGGTGYITDLGMVGSFAGVLGVSTDAVLRQFVTKMPSRFESAVGDEKATGALFTVTDGKCVKVERIEF